MTDQQHQSIRNQFPFLQETLEGKPWIYLDNAATTQKPQVVLDALQNYYTQYNSNVHRGIHTKSREATEMMESSRQKIQNFINAQHPEEVIFTSGTTHSINLLTHAISSSLQPGDEIIISHLEHHSNIVPWQMLCERTGAILKVIPINSQAQLNIDSYQNFLSPQTKWVSVNHISNALGVHNPIETIIKKAHQVGAKVCIDAAQSIAHIPIDVQQLDVDILCFSGHKMYGPTGTGVIYGKKELLENLPPFFGGGEMIESVSFEKTTYAGLPFRFEAGTPNIAGNIVLGTAVDFIQSMGWEAIQQHDAQLMNYAQEQLSQIEEVEIYAQETPKIGAISFNLNLPGVHSSDVGMILDKMGIAVRTGHHCTQPIMNYFQIPGTVRASFSIYNTQEEINQLIQGVTKAIKMLG